MSVRSYTGDGQAVDCAIAVTNVFGCVTDTAGGITSFTLARRAGIENTYGSDSTEVIRSFKAMDFKSGKRFTLADDVHSTLTFTGTTYGILAINGPTALSGPCIVAFRVGTFPYCQLIAGDPLAVNVGTGVLTDGGSDGVDQRLNIFTHTDNKIYIKNRTSNTRVYQCTLLSLDGNNRIEVND
jgi:hypothetical protein